MATPPVNKTNIVLVGFMGTGKSSAGRRAARRLHRAFVDMDGAIEAREGRTIRAIFARDGEAHFRRLEHDLVRELAAGTDQVIGAGGGVVLNPENIQVFSRTGTVICLQASPEKILERVGRSSHRPLLECGDKRRQIVELLATRKPLYDACECQVDTTELSVEQVVDRILEIAQKAKG